VPVGLIVNELATNAIKYAFPDGRPGTIRVDFRSADAGCVLEVSDDGVGFGSAPIAPTRRPEGGSLGLFLVRSLTTQLRGTLTAESSPEAGSRFTVVFQP
jgi:two-component sensor histidine kinase